MKNQQRQLSIKNILLVGSCLFLPIVATYAQSLPVGVTAKPIYDTTKAGLSFKKDQLSIVGMYEVPGKVKHFLVVGYFGYMWTLYPDTTKADTIASWGPIKRYTRTQVADFNTWVMKGWEFGALGGAFDPNFAANHYFYVIYNKFPNPSQYKGGLKPSNNNDGPGNPGALVVIDRYKMSPDFKTVARDTEMIRILHGTGYGSSNMIFGSDGLAYISTDAYDASSWDSTIFARKILRVDFSKQDAGKMYHIPTDNPWYNAANPLVKKEVYAFGFRNSYSMSYNYLTGKLYAAETGQGTWEEINNILPGKNYGWNNGGDASVFKGNSLGIEGPCNVGNSLSNTVAGGAFTATSNVTGEVASYMVPYTRTITGTSYNGVYDCTKFQNPTWYFGHSPTGNFGLANSYAIGANVGNISPVFRGATSSPFYGYMFISDINHNHFLAVKTDGATPIDVGQFPAAYKYVSGGDRLHDGITTWSEDSYGNLYPILMSSSSSGAFDWHDIFMLSHNMLTPLTTPRDQVLPTQTHWNAFRAEHKNVKLVVNAKAGMPLEIPKGYSRVEIFNIDGKQVWSHVGEASDLRVPQGLGNGILEVRFLP